MDYASSILGLLPTGRRSIGVTQLLNKLETYLPPAQVDRVRDAYEFGAEAHEGQKRLSGEPYIAHPGRGRRHPRRPAPGRADDRRGDPARRHRGHADRQGRDRRALRRRRRRAGRRRLQARSHPVPQPRRGAGRELPQDAAGDGARHPRHHGQARRPHAQHAHARLRAAGEAPHGRARDAGDLRADRQPPRHPLDQVRARGARLQGAVSGPLPHHREGAEEARAATRSSSSARSPTTCAARWRRPA